MTELLLVKQASLEGFTEAEKEAVRKFLFHCMDGLSESDKKGWRGWWRRFMDAEVGELFKMLFKRDRSGPYHRRTMKILNAVFDAQDRFTDWEQFLNWLKIGCAWVVWVAGPKGGIVPLPKSISYRAADQDEFMVFHAQAMQFLRGDYAARYLWHHLKREQADEMMDTILKGFEE